MDESESKPKVQGSSRITTFFDEEKKRTVVVTVLFWSDGTVTWVPEDHGG